MEANRLSLDGEYPALFRCSDDAANQMQSLYLRLIRAEYGLLFVAAVFSMEVLSGPVFYAIYTFIFVISIAILLTRALKKPEQDWYKCRALAESIKTLTWRYVMRAAPFEDAAQLQIPRSAFRNHLHEVFSENRAIAEKIAPDWSAEAQITHRMDEIRGLSLLERKAFYTEQRVRDQRVWYAKKAGWNRRAAKVWVAIGVLAYFIAGALAFSRIVYPGWQFWPIEPIIVIASSVIGWMQIKKFNELSAAYTVTAHEIGLIAPIIDSACTEEDFSASVNEAELAFSREHTLWIARQAG